MQNCSFSYIGSGDVKQGGALNLEDTHININDTMFENNTAESGGAILYELNDYNLCSSHIEHSQFINNTATQQGGAIYNIILEDLILLISVLLVTKQCMAII